MHCGHAFACIETVTERRRLRRLFLRFSFPIVCTLPAVAVTKSRLRQKPASLCPFANCTKKQLFRRGYASIFLLLSGSLFCAVFFCVFLLPIVDTLLAVVVTKARLLQKLASCAPLKIVRKNNFFGVAIQAFSCFCQALYFAPSFLHWKGVFRLSETGSNACAKYKRVLIFFIFGKSGAIGFFILFVLGKISLHNIYF